MKPPSNPITPAGMHAMKARYEHLFGTERPEIVEIISWAAGNGDRSENGDYLYGRKRLREIDREISYLSRRMKEARVIDPAQQVDRERVFFGAKVTLADENDENAEFTLIGDDEQDASARRIGWSSPMARALKGARVGDVRIVAVPAGSREWEVMAIHYPPAS
ncbi:transcription elongation factor GreB [Pontixanthobacter gangjinensis]|uniref:Transcription elongation factor GreB n=1 Tax=Pontixanthobacter gangjinensis TaxID=1028742 RepID=A0A6I4SMP0_9SPHN|nr:transcription elongation factor GreB [Pontixanthobacter gangjinensis]MXO56708.1 transcription elongation factor GreB [Pontixanthobacter gangjinensis]